MKGMANAICHQQCKNKNKRLSAAPARNQESTRPTSERIGLMKACNDIEPDIPALQGLVKPHPRVHASRTWQWEPYREIQKQTVAILFAFQGPIQDMATATAEKHETEHVPRPVRQRLSVMLCTQLGKTAQLFVPPWKMPTKQHIHDGTILRDRRGRGLRPACMKATNS